MQAMPEETSSDAVPVPVAEQAVPEQTIPPENTGTEPVPEAASSDAALVTEPVSESLPPEPAPPQSAPAHAPAPAPVVVPPSSQPTAENRWGRFSHAEVVAQALAKRRARTEANLQKIMAYVAKKGSVSNDEVEKLDKVVDSTAASYLKQLVSRGLLRKVGSNRATRYESPDR